MPKTKEQSPASDLRPDEAAVASHLTRELLDWATAALSAVLSTPEVKNLHLDRPQQALVTALKQIDHLWPYAK